MGRARPVVPFGVVGRRDAPVAVPLAWDELDDAGGGVPAWTVGTVAARLREGDPWEGLVGTAQVLPSL